MHDDINGDTKALVVDRAIGELRRGRCIAVSTAGLTLVIGAAETIQRPQLERLIGAGGNAFLMLTAERARASGLDANAAGPIGLALDAPADLELMKLLAGIGGRAHAPGLQIVTMPWPNAAPVIDAAQKLVKSARLVPAIVASRAPVDPSLLAVPADDIADFAPGTGSGIHLVSESRVPLAGSEHSRVALFRDDYGGSEHVAVLIGQPDLASSVPVRLHSACLTGDLLASLRCDCGEQLTTAVERIAALGGGILLYLDQEGRSIGLANKLRAYQIQDTGIDTYDADRFLGFSSDER
ncbi:MAG: GTP cyclohydrolase II RibA, partial [Gammaproteobacteria bacterium]|nr:GTP cyclohydrolase II RibA [Gammaproteobacteria bacterium]